MAVDKRLTEITHKVTNFINNILLYAVDTFSVSPQDGKIELKDLLDYINVPVDANTSNIATNVTNIATNTADIATNTADIANRVMLQSKSFITPSTGTISNSSSTIYVDTDLIVAITPKSATSKLRINTQSGWSWINPNQQGVRIKLSYKIGAGVWTTYKSKIIRDYESISSGRDYFDNFFGQIDSPGITDEVQFKISFAVSSDTYNADYESDGSLIIVDEIEE